MKNSMVKTTSGVLGALMGLRYLQLTQAMPVLDSKEFEEAVRKFWREYRQGRFIRSTFKLTWTTSKLCRRPYKDAYAFWKLSRGEWYRQGCLKSAASVVEASVELAKKSSEVTSRVIDDELDRENDLEEIDKLIEELTKTTLEHGPCFN